MMHKSGRICIAVLILFFMAHSAIAGETLVLTLDESIGLAISQNPNHLAFGQRVEGARSKVREAAAGFFPSLNAQGLTTLDEKVFSLEFPSFIPGQPPQRVEVDFTRDYQFALSLSIPIFTGGRLISGFKQARYNLKASEEALRQSQHTTVYNTKRAFYGYLLAEQFVLVAEEAVGVAEKHFQNVKSLYEVGMASKFDLLRSEVDMANLKPQLIRARNSLRIAELSFKTILGLDLAQPVKVKGEITFTPYEPDLEECIVEAIKNRPELNQMRYQKGMAHELLRMSHADYLPTVAISGTYNYWADLLNFRQDNWQDYYTVNLVFTMPLFNGLAASARVAQSKAAIKELELSQKGLLEIIKFEVRQSVLKIQEAKESLFSQEKNVEQAQEALRIAELNFAEGLATTLDVSSVQAALTQAKTNYVQALYDYVIAMAELDKAMGLN